MAALVAVAWAALFGAWRDDRRRLLLVALLLLFIDLGSFSREAAPRMPREFFTPPPIVNAFDRDRESYRVFNRGEWIHDENLRQLAAWSVQWFARNGVRPYTNAAWGLSSVLEADFDETALLPTHDLLAIVEGHGEVDRSPLGMTGDPARQLNRRVRTRAGRHVVDDDLTHPVLGSLAYQQHVGRLERWLHRVADDYGERRRPAEPLRP